MFPQELDGAKVLYHTPKDDFGEIYYTTGEIAEYVKYLAICQYADKTDEYYLFQCNEDFEVVGDSPWESIEQCMAVGNSSYGYEVMWIEAENTLYPLNRYDVKPIIEYINSLDELPDDFEIRVKEPHLWIEIMGCNEVTREKLLEIVESFSYFDNMVQSLFEENAKKHPDKKPYFFEPSHIEISRYEVRIGYQATNVNSEYVAVFRKYDGEWRLEV